MTVVALIDRYYDSEPLWGGRERWEDHPAEWGVHVEYGSGPDGERPFEERWFDEVEVAIEWARSRSAIVLVRLGYSDLEVYSAGSVRANERLDGTASDYPEWPPDNWPDYQGPSAERRRFTSTYDSEPVEPVEASSPERRYIYRVISLEPDEEPGVGWEGWVTTRREAETGDRLWFPTLGWEIWLIEEATQPGPGGRNFFGGGLDLGSAGVIRCKGFLRLT